MHQEIQRAPQSSQAWHLARNGQQYGPYAEGELQQMAAAGELYGGDSLWREGMGAWIPVPSVFPQVPPAAPAEAADTIQMPAPSNNVYVSTTVHSPHYRPRSAFAAGFGATTGVIIALIVIPLLLFIGCAVIGGIGAAAHR